MIFDQIWDWFIGVGAFLMEHQVTVLVAGLAFMAVALICQMVINASLEEDLIELCERIEAMEKALGIVANGDTESKKEGE